MNPILDSLGRTEDDLLASVAALRTAKKRLSLLRRWVAAASCVCLLVSTALTAEAASGSVSNLLAPLFGMAQTKIVDSIGVPVGVSATSGGYTLTVDAIIGDRYNYAVVYTMTRDDGQPMPEGRLTLSGWDFTRRGSGGGSLTAGYPGDAPNQVHFISHWQSSSAMLGRYISVSFEALVADDFSGGETVIAKGPWQVDFTLRYQDATRKVPTGNVLVQDSAGGEYQVKKLYLSPVGIKIELLQYDPVVLGDAENHILKRFQVSLEMKDGTVIPIRDCNMSQNFSQGEDEGNAHFQAFFDTPVDLNEVAAVIVCGTPIPVTS